MARAQAEIEPVPLNPPDVAPEREWDGEAHGWLGVEVGRAEEVPAGVRVLHVVRKSPADLGGLEVGDLLLSVAGKNVHHASDVVTIIGAHRAGARLPIRLRRDGQDRLLSAVLMAEPGADQIMRMQFVGEPAPAFEELATVQGGLSPSLSPLKGRVVVLEFWAEWCAVCRYLVPTMNAWRARYGPQGAEVVGITTDSVRQASFAAFQMDIRYSVFSDESGETTRAYRALALPTLFVLDRQGIVRDVMVGYSASRLVDLEKLVRRLVES